MYPKMKLGLFMAALALSGAIWAHSGSQNKPSQKKEPQAVEEMAFGRAGDPKKVTRTIYITMHDEMRFVASSDVKRAGIRSGSNEITVQQGDTVRFVVANKGKVMHEMVIGTLPDLKEHAELMRKHPGMEHDEPYMAHVAPGKKGDIVWQFTKPGEFHYACLVAGHFEAGMLGKIRVAANRQCPGIC